MIEFIKRHKNWLFPCLLMGMITPFTPWLDMKIETYFYSLGKGGEPFFQHPVLDFFYEFGPVPGFITVILAAVVLFLSYIVSPLKKWQPHALFLVVVLAIGSGLVTHALLKDHWGRPRPKHLVEFGGNEQFRPYYQPNFNATVPLRSFPCGHCTMGFYFLTFVLLGRRMQKKWLFNLGVVLTLFLGGALSFTRMAQGGHFFSDVLVSGLVMWLVALMAESVIFEKST